MRDQYPTDSSIPPGYLVPPFAQPEFRDLDGCHIREYDNIADRIIDANNTSGRGQRPAVVHAESGRTYTFEQLAAASSRLARGLRNWGIRPGDRIALRAANVPEMVVVALACWKAGAVTVPTPAQARADELRFFLEDTGARLLFVSDRPELFADALTAATSTAVEKVIAFGQSLAPGQLPEGVMDWSQLLTDELTSLPQTSADAVAVIWFTGGTTGQPKAIYHTHRRMLLGAYALARSTGVASGQRWAAATPVGHALGFAAHTVWTLLHGATAVMVENFQSPSALVAAISRHRVDTFLGITVTWARILEVVETDPSIDLRSLKRGFAMWQSASSGHIFDAWASRGIELRNNLGCTSFSSWILCPIDGEPVPRASLGRAVPGYEIRAVVETDRGFEDVGPGQFGRLIVRGVSGLTYWNRPDMQLRDVRDGWVLVDDLVTFDRDGFATYLGRSDFLISSAGHKIAPVEVEEVLARHPAVKEVAVVGAPDPVRGEVVTAYVVIDATVEATPDLRRELQDFVKANLSPYKYPRRVEFIRELPRDHVGKLQSSVVRTWAAAKGGEIR